MNATIYVLREWESIEYHFAVEVGLDSAGDIEAIVGEDVPERYWTTRFGGLELEETGYLKFSQGEEIELEEEELEEAREALAQMEKAWEYERMRLKEIFRTSGKNAAQVADDKVQAGEKSGAESAAPTASGEERKNITQLPRDEGDDQRRSRAG